MSSSPPALSRWRRGVVPLLIAAACASGCGAPKDSPRAAESPSTSVASTTSSPAATTSAPSAVRRVVDWRTLVDADGERVQINYLDRLGECWAKAATDYTTNALMGKPVKIRTIVAYFVSVELPDGSDFAETALREGMARAQPMARPTLTDAEALAREAGTGLWGGTCQDPTTTPPLVTSPPPSQEAPAVAPPPPVSTLDPPAVLYQDCASARAAGVTPLRRGDPGYGSHLDRDEDGIACG